MHLAAVGSQSVDFARFALRSGNFEGDTHWRQAVVRVDSGVVPPRLVVAVELWLLRKQERIPEGELQETHMRHLTSS